MKAMVGSSILIDSYEAGIETARNSMKGLKNPKVGLLFSSIKHNQEDLISGIKSVVPEINIGSKSSTSKITAIA